MTITKISKAAFLILGAVFFVGLAAALSVDMNIGWHTASQIVNGGGRVFTNAAKAYKCDSLSNPATTATVDPNGPVHPLQQFSKTASDMTSIDSNSNGWPDVGLSLSAPGSQAAGGTVTTNIVYIKKKSSDSTKIDSNNNGWPDRCDCVESELGTDENNCGSCGNACGVNYACINNKCRYLDSIDLSVTATCQSSGGQFCTVAKSSGNRDVVEGVRALFTFDCTGHWGAPSSCWGRIYKNGDVMFEKALDTPWPKSFSQWFDLGKGKYKVEAAGAVKGVVTSSVSLEGSV